MPARLTAVPAHKVRAGLYVRVSAVMGRAGDDRFHSPDLQLQAMRKFIEQRGLVEKYVWTDIDQTGRNFNREGIREAFAAARAGQVDAIVVLDLSRLGRNTAETLRHVSELREMGVSLVSTVEQIDDSPEGQFMLTQFCSMAQLYSDQLARRWADTATHVARSGHFHGQVPLGYRRVPPRRVVVDDQAAAVVQRIFARYDAGWSFAQIARDVAPLLGTRTRPTTIREILSNPAYLGKVRLRGEVYDGQHPALVEERLWHRVQQRLQRPRLPSRTVQASHALAGLVRCGQEGCGLVMVRKPGRTRQGGRRVALVCQGMEIHACPGVGAPDEEQVQAAVLDEISALAQRLKADETERLERRRARAATRSLAKDLESQLSKIDQAVERLTLKLGEDLITDRAYASAVETYELKRIRLVAELALAQESTAAPATVTVSEAEKIRRDWPRMSGPQRNRVLRSLMRSVEVLPAARHRQPVVERLRVAWL
ncbi:MAG: cassette chromosome recombinase [Frankiales bacterium]|nr:cassette chromosome recombinase [Frankiales bacterium]